MVLLKRNGVEKLWKESDVAMLKQRGWVEVNPPKQEQKPEPLTLKSGDKK